MRRARIEAAIAFAALALGASGCARRSDAAAQWPTKSITLIVPFKPGGGFDLQARIFAPFLEKHLPSAVQVVVENVDGAAGRMAAAQLARSAPDGHTIAILGLESIAFMSVLGQLPDDPGEWTWLGQLSSDALLAAATAQSGIEGPQDMKSRDFRFGVTSEMLPSAALLAHTLGTSFRPVHFDGSGDVMLAGRRGDIDALIASWPSVIKGVRDSDGKMRPLFVVSEERVATLPDVPTLAEMGVEPDPGFYAIGSVSRALGAPRGLPADVRQALVAAIDAALADPEFRKAMGNAEFEVVTATPSELSAKLEAATAEFAVAASLLEPFLAEP